MQDEQKRSSPLWEPCAENCISSILGQTQQCQGPFWPLKYILCWKVSDLDPCMGPCLWHHCKTIRQPGAASDGSQITFHASGSIWAWWTDNRAPLQRRVLICQSVSSPIPPITKPLDAMHSGYNGFTQSMEQNTGAPHCLLQPRNVWGHSTFQINPNPAVQVWVGFQTLSFWGRVHFVILCQELRPVESLHTKKKPSSDVFHFCLLGAKDWGSN